MLFDRFCLQKWLRNAPFLAPKTVKKRYDFRIDFQGPPASRKLNFPQTASEGVQLSMRLKKGLVLIDLPPRRPNHIDRCRGAMWTGSSLCQCNLSLLCRLKMVPKWSKMIPKTVEAAEEALKTTQDGPETPQEAPQDRPRASPDHPDDPKRHPRGTPEPPGALQNRSKNRSENRLEIRSDPGRPKVAPELRL